MMLRFVLVVVGLIAAIFMLVTGARADIYITVVKSEQRMYVETPDASFAWDVSTARKGYRTPVGDYQPYVLKKIHYSRKYDNAPMPNSIFFHGGYAIHATYDVKHLGSPASHGCIRLAPEHAKWLYHIVQESGKENTYIRIME